MHHYLIRDRRSHLEGGKYAQFTADVFALKMTAHYSFLLVWSSLNIRTPVLFVFNMILFCWHLDSIIFIADFRLRTFLQRPLPYRPHSIFEGQDGQISSHLLILPTLDFPNIFEFSCAASVKFTYQRIDNKCS